MTDERVPMQWSKLLCPQRLRGTQSPDGRSEFERDYGRVIFSTPVRRLQDKTQVFPLDPNDSVRTRLTHSLEVSTVARNVAARVAEDLVKKEEISQDQSGEIQTIAATCGLVHDLGNPPFGHAGEWAIQEWFSRKFDSSAQSVLTDPSVQLRDLLGFDGNPQTMRLLVSLQILVDKRGMNLTAGTLHAALKYPESSASRGHTGKLGYFQSEAEAIKKVRDLCGGYASRSPIAYLVEIADDAVNSAVDIEDGVRKGVVGWRDVVEHLQCVEVDGSVWVDGFNREMQSKYGSDWDAYSDQVKVELFRTSVISTVVRESVKEFVNGYDSIMSGRYESEVTANSKAGTLVKACKSFTKERVFSTNSDILRLEIMARKVIHDLMDIFWGAWNRNERKPSGKYGKKIYRVMSENYRSVYEKRTEAERLSEADILYARAQLIADYVCGMTDSFACSLHRKLSNA